MTSCPGPWPWHRTPRTSPASTGALARASPAQPSKPKEVREESDRLQSQEKVNDEKLTSGSTGGAAGEGGATRGRRAEAPMRHRRPQRQPQGWAARVRPRRGTEVDGRRRPARAIGGSATRHHMSASAPSLPLPGLIRTADYSLNEGQWAHKSP